MTVEKKSKKGGQNLPAITEGNTVQSNPIQIGIHLFLACASETIVMKGKEYTNREFVNYLNDSGIAQKIIDSQPSDNKKSMAHVWWDNIKLESKLKPFDKKRKTGEPPKPRKRSAIKKDAFLKWAKDNNIDTGLALDRLTSEVNDAYDEGKIEIRIGRSTVRECLTIIRKKKK